MLSRDELTNLLCKQFSCIIAAIHAATIPTQQAYPDLLRVKLVDCKRALNLSVVPATDRSKAVVLVLLLFCVALWLILQGDLY